MSAVFTPKAGQKVYMQDGAVGRWLAKAGPDGHLVRTTLIVEGFDGEEFEEDGPIHQVSRVFASPPRAALDDEISRLNGVRADLEKQIADQRREIYQFDLRKAERAKEAQFATLDLFLQKKITHLVYEGSGVVYYKPFEKAIKENEDRHWSEMRLIGLFGNSNGQLDWRINSYRDGSGTWSGIIPCQSEDEAREIALRRTAENMAAAYEIASQSDSDYWRKKAVIDMAAEMAGRGYPVPAEASAMAADMAIKSAESAVQHRRDELEKAEAALEAVRVAGTA